MEKDLNIPVKQDQGLQFVKSTLPEDISLASTLQGFQDDA